MWRFSWYDSQGKRRYTTRTDKTKAIQAARNKAREIHNGTVTISDLPPEKIRVVQAFIDLNPTWDDIQVIRKRARVTEITVAAAFSAFMDSKRASAGASPHNVRILAKRAGAMAAHFAEMPLSSVTPDQLDRWLISQRTWGALTRRNVRSSINTFFRWCQDRNWIEPGRSAATSMAIPIVTKSTPTTYTPKEYSLMLAAVTPEYLPWLALGGLAGIRREELYPDPSSGKDALAWEHFLWEQNIIVVPPSVSKTNRKRTIPICQRLANLLSAHRSSSGRCTSLTPPEKTNHGKPSETSRLGQFAGGWKTNALRHSFISYRAALVGSGIAANEAGNSEAQTRANYQDSKTEREAREWFCL